MTHLRKNQSEAETHRLVGGALCLDFANTINGHGRTNPHEYLPDYADLVRWCHKAGILPEIEVQALIQRAARQLEQAEAALKHAKMLRENIYHIFSAFALGSSPGTADLVYFNGARKEALAQSQIVRKEAGFSLDWPDKTSLHHMLWPITLSAADLLTSGNIVRIHQCAGKGCDWLFLDTSRNHLRRWCTMDECGNRAKSRRFVERKLRPAEI